MLPVGDDCTKAPTQPTISVGVGGSSSSGSGSSGGGSTT